MKTERELELEVQLAAARAAFADRAKLAAELERDLVTLKQAVRSLLLGAHPDPFDGLDAAAVEDGLRALRLLVTPQQDGPAAAPVRS